MTEGGWGQDRGIKNGQSRLMSRYVLVLPLGQTASELLSQRSLARWRIESCPGASGCRSEERKGKQAWKTGQIEETGTTDPSCRCFHKTCFLLQVCVQCCFYCSPMIILNFIDPCGAALFVLSFKGRSEIKVRYWAASWAQCYAQGHFSRRMLHANPFWFALAADIQLFCRNLDEEIDAIPMFVHKVTARGGLA